MSYMTNWDHCEKKKKNHHREPHPPEQMTVQRGFCGTLDTRSEATTTSQPENKMDCQPRSPRGKTETAATFGRVMSWQGIQEKTLKALHVFMAPSCHRLSLGKRYACLSTIAPSVIRVHLSPLPPSPQRCATVFERPNLIIQLLNTEWAQVILIKEGQRLLTVICNPLEGFLGQWARGRTKMDWNNSCFIFTLI